MTVWDLDVSLESNTAMVDPQVSYSLTLLPSLIMVKFALQAKRANHP